MRQNGLRPGHGHARPTRRRDDACVRVRAAHRASPEHAGRLQVAREHELAGAPSGPRPARRTARRAPVATSLERDARASLTRACRPLAPRRGSSRSRCSGRCCRTAPRGSRRRVGSRIAVEQVVLPPRRARACRIRTARRRPRRTPAGRGWSSPSAARPSTVTTSCPSACAASTRHAQTSSPSTRTEHEPHSPCSHAPFDPGRPSRSRNVTSRLSPAHASASRTSPLTVSSTRTGTDQARQRSSARRVRTRSAWRR